MCVSSIHSLCSQLTIQNTKDYLLCQKSIARGHILAVHERGFIGSSKTFHAGSLVFYVCLASIFHLILLIIPHVGCVNCICSCSGPLSVTLQTHTGIISHFPLHQQFCAGFRNPWMLLLDSFFFFVSQIL